MAIKPLYNHRTQNKMLTALLIATSILLALSGLALIKLSNAYRHQVACYDVLQSTFQSYYDDLITERDKAISELQTIKHNAYHREQELLNALEDATKAADDNEWLYKDAQTDLNETITELQDAQWTIETMQREYAELEDELKSTIEGYDTYHAEQADELARYMAAYDAACAELDEAIEAAAPQEDILHIEDNKVWTVIDNWTRLIVYKSSPYHCYIQEGIDGKIQRLAAAQMTDAQRMTFRALKVMRNALKQQSKLQHTTTGA